NNNNNCRIHKELGKRKQVFLNFINLYKIFDMYNTLLTTIENNILTITINRPDKLNALKQQVMEELGEAIDEAEIDSQVRSIIITGAGEKAFVAGADIKEFLSVYEGEKLAKKGQDIFFKIENASKPVVA